MKRLLLAASFCLTACAVASAAPLDPLLTTGNLWTLKPDEFLSQGEPLGFHWTSSAHDSARVAQPGLTLYGLPVVESVARFDASKPTEIIVTFYARGDAGDLPKEKFDALVIAAANAITTASGVKYTARGKDPANAVRADGLLWQAAKAQSLLEFSFTKEVKTRGIPFRAEFVRLAITPAVKAQGLLATAAPVDRAKFSGPAHLKKDAASGDVWIGDVPMVDQGQKGYCVVASTERVMRYYGNAVDQQELAQVANTSTDGGTSNQAMLEALKKLSARLKVRVREIEGSDIHELLKLMADYNRAAKHADAAPIPDQGNLIDVGAVYRAMKPEVLKEVRTRNKSDLNRFERSIESNIEQGTPLLWSVMLGLIAEPGIPQNAGGHMRLIIGYNQKKEEILFTDSWGAGHELKRMPLADAWTITTGLTKIEPL